jgi:hypothetical protein
LARRGSFLKSFQENATESDFVFGQFKKQTKQKRRVRRVRRVGGCFPVPEVGGSVRQAGEEPNTPTVRYTGNQSLENSSGHGTGAESRRRRRRGARFAPLCSVSIRRVVSVDL